LNTEALKGTNRLMPFCLAKSIKAFIGGETSITAGAVRKTEAMFWAFSNGTLNVLLSSQSNLQQPLFERRGLLGAHVLSVVVLATLPVPPMRSIVGLEDIVVN
jgi:hypothetical protein